MKIKSFLSFLFLTCCSINLFSQNWLWAKSAGGGSDDYSYSVSSDHSGNVFIAGYFSSRTITFGSTTLINVDTTGQTADVFIAKYDANGNVLWAKSAGGDTIDGGMSVSTDASGNVFVTGYFYSSTITFGSTTLTNASSGFSDIFIVKYDASGNVIWAKSFGGNNNDAANSVSTDGNGNVFITGGFSSPTITFGSTTLINSSSGYVDIFIVKYNASGNVVWAKSAGGSSGDDGKSVCTDNNGNVFVTGWFCSPSIIFGSTTLNNPSSSQYGTYAAIFIVKYNASGNVLWASSAMGVNGDHGDKGNSVSTDASGNVFVAGYFDSGTIIFGTTTLSNLGGYGNANTFIAKYNTSGNILWAKCAWNGDGSDDRGFGISTDGIGNVFITGFNFGSNTTFETDTLNVAGGFVVKYDSNGNVVWAIALSDIGANSICTDASGNVFVTGSFASSTIIFGTTTLSNTTTYTYDIFIAKLSSIAGINENELDNSFLIYPNPTSGVFNLKMSQFENAQMSNIEIYNVYGECIHRQIFKSPNQQIDLSSQPSGIYFLKIITQDGNSAVKKIIKE